MCLAPFTPTVKRGGGYPQSPWESQHSRPRRRRRRSQRNSEVPPPETQKEASVGNVTYTQRGSMRLRNRVSSFTFLLTSTSDCPKRTITTTPRMFQLPLTGAGDDRELAASAPQGTFASSFRYGHAHRCPPTAGSPAAPGVMGRPWRYLPPSR